MKTYNYKGLFPYSAGDLLAMENFVEENFSGNVTQELIKRGAKWDNKNKILTVKGMCFPIEFIER